MARPVKYTKKAIEKIRLDMEKYTKRENIPIVAEFAYKYNVPRQTLYVFAEQDAKFSDTIKQLVAKKESQLEKLGLLNAINPSMAIFSLKQLGWRDKQEMEHSGQVGIKIVEDI